MNLVIRTVVSHGISMMIHATIGNNHSISDNEDKPILQGILSIVNPILILIIRLLHHHQKVI